MPEQDVADGAAAERGNAAEHAHARPIHAAASGCECGGHRLCRERHKRQPVQHKVAGRQHPHRFALLCNARNFAGSPQAVHSHRAGSPEHPPLPEVVLRPKEEPIMAYQPTDPYRAPLSEEEIARQARLNSLDNEIQPDPMLDEGGPGGTKVAMFAVAIAVVLGALFYGLNNTSVNQAGTDQGARTAQTERANPSAPPGMRDVTPKSNSQPGTTTGAAPAQPTTPRTDNPGAK